jgi:hypothetical protein
MGKSGKSAHIRVVWILFVIKAKGGEFMSVVQYLNTPTYAYHVANTSFERPPAELGPNWDDYWKHFSKLGFIGAKCAFCGCSLNPMNRVGAHIRLVSDMDNSEYARIVLCCKICNNWNNSGCHIIRSGTVMVWTRMAMPHRNAV